jgi:hypothetical protein
MVWISQHEPILANATQADTPVARAWLLDANGMHARPAIDFVRFLTVHSGMHWSSATPPPSSAGVFYDRPGRIHTIGLAAFAHFESTSMIYLSHIWGGTYGCGAKYRYRAELGTLECIANIWRS